MNKNKRTVVVVLLLGGWACLMALINALLAPATGAATVLQMNASNADFIVSVGAGQAGAGAAIAVTGVCALLIYLALRRK